MTIKLITDLGMLNKAIDTIAKAGAKLDVQIQEAGVSAIAHHQKCGDTGPINRLYLALAKGARKSAMTSWLLTHAGVVANTDKDSKNEKPFLHDKEKASDYEAAAADPWFDHKPDVDPDKVFDVQAALRSVLKKAAKAKNVEHGELMGAVQALLDAPTATLKAAAEPAQA